MRTKKRVLLYGNCQLTSLRKILESSADFLEQFEIVHLNDVHMLSSEEINQIHELLPEIDYFVHQPVKDYKGDARFNTKNLKQKLSSHARHFSFPSLYFRGYNPGIVHLYDNSGHKRYIDANIYYLVYQGWTLEEIESLIRSREFYNTDQYTKIIAYTIQELSIREGINAVDVKVSEFIIDNFSDQRLFYTPNHPSKATMLFIANALLKFLNLSSSIDSEAIDESSMGLNFIQNAIYPSVIRHLTNREAFKQVELRRNRLNDRAFKILPFRQLIIEVQEIYQASSKDIIRRNLEIIVNKPNRNFISPKLQELSKEGIT